MSWPLNRLSCDCVIMSRTQSFVFFFDRAQSRKSTARNHHDKNTNAEHRIREKAHGGAQKRTRTRRWRKRRRRRGTYPRVPVVSALAPPASALRSNAGGAKNREIEFTMKVILIVNSFLLIKLSYYQACTLHCMFTLSISCSLLLSLLLPQPSKKRI